MVSVSCTIHLMHFTVGQLVLIVRGKINLKYKHLWDIICVVICLKPCYFVLLGVRGAVSPCAEKTSWKPDKSYRLRHHASDAATRFEWWAVEQRSNRWVTSAPGQSNGWTINMQSQTVPDSHLKLAVDIRNFSVQFPDMPIWGDPAFLERPQYGRLGTIIVIWSNLFKKWSISVSSR